MTWRVGTGLVLLGFTLYCVWNFRYAIAYGAVSLLAIRILAHRMGYQTRRTFAANVKALALAYASWNTRWLKGTSPVKARVPAKGQPTGEDFGEMPY